jgi:hypothetical protein
VYVFADGENVNLENPKALKAIVFADVNTVIDKKGKASVTYELKDLKKGKYTVVVTVLDRAWNESLNGVETTVKI